MGPWFPGAACLFAARVYNVILKGFEVFCLEASCFQSFTYYIFDYIRCHEFAHYSYHFLWVYNSRTQEPRTYCPRLYIPWVQKGASTVACVLATGGTWLHFLHLVPQLTSDGRITHSELDEQWHKNDVRMSSHLKTLEILEQVPRLNELSGEISIWVGQTPKIHRLHRHIAA